MKITEGVLWIYKTIRDQTYHLELSTSGAIWDYLGRKLPGKLSSESVVKSKI